MKHSKLCILLLLTVIFGFNVVSAQSRDYKLTVSVASSIGESLEGVVFSLKCVPFDLVYPEQETVLDADGKCEVMVYGGEHQISVSKAGMKSYEETFEVEADKELNIELVEDVKTPFALTSSIAHDALTGRNDVTLSWNREAPAFFDDFESYDSFSIQFGEWTGIDVDEQNAAPLSGSYPNRGMRQYATIINPLAVDPVWWYEYPVLRPYSGKQYAGFVRTNSGVQNDDWLISPAITVGTDNVLSFFVKAADVYKERFQVAITEKTDNPTVADFTVISMGNYEMTAGYENWEKKVYSLSEYAGKTVKIAIRYMSNANQYGAFMLMVDDFYVGQPDYGEEGMKARRAVCRSLENPNEKFELYLDGDMVGTTEDYSYSFENVAEGEHTFGVKAVYKQAASEMATLKVNVSNADCHKVEIAVTTNTGVSADGMKVSFLNEATSEVVETAVAEGKAVVASLPAGKYLVNIAADNFDSYEESKEITADASWAVELKETIVMPGNITVDVEKSEDGGLSAVVKWNQDLGFSDSFEEYDDFASGEFGGWTTLDLDQMPVYPIALGSQSNIVTFPGSGTPESPVAIVPMVFNPYETVPAMLPTDVAVAAPTGDKTVIFFSPQMAVADKWLISPAQEVRDGYVWKVAAKAYSSMYMEAVRFCISTESVPESMQVLDEVSLKADEWTVYTLDLSAYAGQTVYLGINYVANDGFFSQVDDFYVGPAEEGGSVDVGDVKEYEVYLDGTLVGTAATAEFRFDGLTEGEHTVGIVAVYATGKSEMAEYTFNAQAGVDSVGQDAASAFGGNGEIHVATDKEAEVAVYGISGQLLETRKVAGSAAIAVAPGMYIVEIGAETFKVAVR